MKVFLTGATGFIGLHLVDALLRRQWEVTVLVRKTQSAEAASLALKGANLAQGDVTNRESMRAPMAGADIVIHNAAWYEIGIGGSEAERQMQAVNVEGARNALTLAHELGIARIVHVSSIVAVGHTGGAEWDESASRRTPPPNAYERTKTEAHNLALALIAQGAPICIAMPGSVFGPGDHANLGILQRMYVRNLCPPLTVGHGVRGYVEVSDCAEGIALVAEKGLPGESYILSNTNMTYGEIHELWSSAPGGMKRMATMPVWMADFSGVVGERVQRWFGLPNLLSLDATRAAEQSYRFSGAKAKRELEWRPGDVNQQWLETLAEERRRAGK